MDTNLGGKLSEDVFYNKYFIKSLSYDQINERLDSIFNTTSQFSSTSIFLHGYSGIGKTTYIRWYAKNRIDTYNKVFFDLADVVYNDNCCYIKDEYPKEGSVRLFDIYFHNLICNIFHNFPDVFNDLLSTLFSMQLKIATYFSPDFNNSIRDYYQNYINDINSTAFISFTSNCSYNDLLMMLLFFYYYHPSEFGQYFKTPIDEELPLLIIFDNIDHVEIESHNSEFPKNIESVAHNIKTIIRKQDNIKINKTIHFIFCLRDANCSIISRQMAENTTRYEVKFIPLREETDIFLKRVSIASKHDVNFDSNKCEFFSYIFNDEYTKKSFLPLFNYNMRKFSVFLYELVEESNSTYVNDIKDLSNNFTKYGSRGIEYHLIIKHLLKNDFLKQRLYLNDGNLCGGVNGGHVNPARVLLTNVLNKSKYSLDYRTWSNTSNPVGLYNLYYIFAEVHKGKIDLFFDILTGLFLFHKENWCHLITFENKQIFSDNDFLSEKETLKMLDTGLTNDETIYYKQKLNKITVRLNPAGFTYIRDICKHYEFYSIRVDNKKPLFCSLDYKFANGSIKFDFISNIKNTFNLAKECIENLIKFLDSGVVGNYSYSDHCFRTYNPYDEFEDDPYQKPRSVIHTIRIIDTHVGYIDTFRLYILNNYPYFNEVYTHINNGYNVQINIDKVKKDINKEIIDIIEQYVSFLVQINEGGEDTKNLMNIFHKNINIIKRNEYCNYKMSINNGRN